MFIFYLGSVELLAVDCGDLKKQLLICTNSLSHSTNANGILSAKSLKSVSKNKNCLLYYLRLFAGSAGAKNCCRHPRTAPHATQ